MRFEVHSHTEFSNARLLDCINKPEKLIKRAQQIGLSGIAITDHEILSAGIRANKIAKELKDTGFKVALGNEIYLTDTRENGQKYYHFILIAKDAIGYALMRELSTTAWLNGYMDKMERVPTLKSELKEMISKYGKGHLIATTACLGGELSTLTLGLCDREEVGDEVNAEKYHNRIVNFMIEMKDLFGDDFYIECAPGRSQEQITVNNRLLLIAKAFGVKMVIGTDAHYLSKEDKYVHAAFLNSRDEDRETEDFYAYSYLQTEEEILENLKGTVLYSEYQNMVNNSYEIYNKIEFFDIEKEQQIPEYDGLKNYPRKKMLIDQPILAELFDSEDIRERFWVNACYESLIDKNMLNEEYLNRLEIEADIIKYIGKQKGVCLFQYFNTFQHYIDLFWECGSIVGPGRGSATGFLSNYLLNITQLDSIKWKLQYWRFLNKERIELPSLLLILGSCKKRALTVA